MFRQQLDIFWQHLSFGNVYMNSGTQKLFLLPAGLFSLKSPAIYNCKPQAGKLL